MIRMVAGVYGLNIKREDGSTYVQGMGPESGPFSVDPNEEARLVGMKVAKYVGNAEQVSPAEAEPPVLPDLPEGVVGIPEYSTRNTVKELQAIAELCGITFEEGMTKAQMVEALDQHIADNTVEGDPDDAPTFDAAEAVQ